MKITGDQVIAARSLLGWTRSELARKSGGNIASIETFETGRRGISVLDVSVIRHVLESAGVEFDDKGHGVRMREGK
jgi:transcriptional regulator with XRE-family HTH domain